MYEINDADIDEVERELDLSFDAPRRAAIKGYGDVQACPGSGKTTMVAAKLLILAKKWDLKYQGVCVLTHTNVAKNEIIDRLKKNVHGLKLLQYPHFIGTIQEFVNKYLAIPYLRSSGFKVSHIDDDLITDKAWRMLNYSARSYLTRKHIDNLHGLKYDWRDELILDVPTFPNGSSSATYKHLEEIRLTLLTEGYFFYKEMYSFARCYLHENPSIIATVLKRFPVAIIDEMQDTQKYQDDLLNEIFDNGEALYQRFGDPDQAIYSSRLSDESNGYNLRTDLEQIDTSHRFPPAIANLAKRMSFNRVDLTSVLPDVRAKNTIFLVDENTRQNAINKFAELCIQHVPTGSQYAVKAVGGTGEHGSEGLDISCYYNDYSKNRAKNSFKPDTLIQYFYKAKGAKEFNKGYQLILDGLIRCAYLSRAELTGFDVYNTSNLKKYLKDSNIQHEFNLAILDIFNGTFSKDQWDAQIARLLNLIQINNLSSGNVSKYIEYQESAVYEEDGLSEMDASDNKLLVEVEGGRQLVEIEFETIHSVKGETHAATLVLETKYRQDDVFNMIDYILGENESSPQQSTKQKFIKQFYVAFSRPKYLLCIVMNKAGFPSQHHEKIEYAGWDIIDLTNTAT